MKYIKQSEIIQNLITLATWQFPNGDLDDDCCAARSLQNVVDMLHDLELAKDNQIIDDAYNYEWLQNKFDT